MCGAACGGDGRVRSSVCAAGGGRVAAGECGCAGDARQSAAAGDVRATLESLPLSHCPGPVTRRLGDPVPGRRHSTGPVPIRRRRVSQALFGHLHILRSGVRNLLKTALLTKL